MKRCSECERNTRSPTSNTCSPSCTKARLARLVKETPKQCPYCPRPIPPQLVGKQRVTCGANECRWKHRQATGAPKVRRAAPKPVVASAPGVELEDGWEMDAIVDLRRRRLQREEELSALWILARRCA